MGFGGKKSSTPAAAKPVATDNNNNVPDDAAARGVPLRDAAPASSQPLLATGDEDKKKAGMLY